MKYLAAYTLLVLAGNKSPSTILAWLILGANDVTNLLKEVGVDVDATSVNRVVEAL